MMMLQNKLKNGKLKKMKKDGGQNIIYTVMKLYAPNVDVKFLCHLIG